jgi:hypothetical protein
MSQHTKGTYNIIPLFNLSNALRNVQSLNFHVSPVDSGVLEPLVGAAGGQKIFLNLVF